MININAWMNRFVPALEEEFGDRVWFVGLQGSYARDEATETSDIDAVVILDQLTSADIQAYGAMLDKLEHRDLICGFFSGKDEIMNWDAADLFQFVHDTKPVKGSLDELLKLIKAEDVDRAIKTGVCGIYHGCVHNMLHEKSGEILKGLYKSASFVVQAVCYRETGRYVMHQRDLMESVSPGEVAIIENCLRIKHNEMIDFDAMSEALFAWCQRWINKTGL